MGVTASGRHFKCDIFTKRQAGLDVTLKRDKKMVNFVGGSVTKKMTHAKRDKKLFMSREAAHRRKRAYNKASLCYLGAPLLYVNN